jgi:hypothetical protein
MAAFAHAAAARLASRRSAVATFSVAEDMEPYVLVAPSLVTGHVDRKSRAARMASRARDESSGKNNLRRGSVQAAKFFVKQAFDRSLRTSFVKQYVGTFGDAAKCIEAMWTEQRKTAFNDTIYAVLISPQDTDDYIALGGKRLYWLDDDVT